VHRPCSRAPSFAQQAHAAAPSTCTAAAARGAGAAGPDGLARRLLSRTPPELQRSGGGGEAGKRWAVPSVRPRRMPHAQQHQGPCSAARRAGHDRTFTRQCSSSSAQGMSIWPMVVRKVVDVSTMLRGSSIRPAKARAKAPRQQTTVAQRAQIGAAANGKDHNAVLGFRRMAPFSAPLPPACCTSPCPQARLPKLKRLPLSFVPLVYVQR
jgi:hypothetical protein